jgi:serine/threonine protein kinase
MYTYVLCSGQRDYGLGVDVWSLGCVYAELLLGRQLFSGICDIDMLFQIFSICGTPTPHTWPSFHRTPNYQPVLFPQFAAVSLPDNDLICISLTCLR